MLTVLALLTLSVTLLLARAPEDKPRSDQAFLDDIKKLCDLTEDQLRPNKDEKKEAARTQEIKKHADQVLDLVQQLEKAHPKSGLLGEAYSQTLDLLDKLAEQDSMPEKTTAIATSLKKVAAKGSDQAGQADLVLFSMELEKVLKDAKSEAKLKAAWTANADRMRKLIEEFLTAYPKYRPGADALAPLVGVAEFAGDDQTRKLILETVAKNIPDHELAKIVLREKAIGKEFEYDYTPVGADKATAIKDLRGKVVLIDFWATWCGPCRGEMPRLKKLYEKHGKDGFEILGISLDETEKALTSYTKDNAIPWPQIYGKDANKLAEKWGVDAIPTMFLVDRKGNLRSVDAREKLDKLIADLLGEK